ncbi:unnamed protein product [Umbelopsis ramanniana]
MSNSKRLRWDCSCCRKKHVFPPPGLSDDSPATPPVPPNSLATDNMDFFIAAYGLSNLTLNASNLPPTPAVELERPELYFSSSSTYCYVSARFNNFTCTRCQTYNEIATPLDQDVSFYAICSQKCMERAVNSQTSPITLGTTFRCKSCNATQIPSVRVIPVQDPKSKKRLDSRLKAKALKLENLRNDGKISSKVRFDHALIKTRPAQKAVPAS